MGGFILFCTAVALLVILVTTSDDASSQPTQSSLGITDSMRYSYYDDLYFTGFDSSHDLLT